MILNNFSSGYWIAPNLDVITHGENEAIICNSLYHELSMQTNQESIVCSTGGSHYELQRAFSVPHGVVAVPEANAGEALLVAKPQFDGVFMCE